MLSNLLRAHLLILAVLLIFPSDGYTLGQTQYVETNDDAENFGIVHDNKAADLYVDPDDYPGVQARSQAFRPTSIG